MTKGRSVLSRQKPRKSRKKVRSTLRRQVGLAIGLIAVLAVTLFAHRAYRRSVERSSAAVAAAPLEIDWKVSIKLDGDQPLADTAAGEIMSLARRTLGTGSRAEISRTAVAIQHLDAYSSVHVLRLSNDQAVIQLGLRIPELCIVADKLRLVSGDGSVYGGVDACPHPVLTGLFADSKAKLTLADDSTLSLNGAEKSAIAEALTLQREAKRRGFTLGTLDYKRYRGFSVKLAGEDLEIAMGRAPFGPKLEKLQDILAKLSAKGDRAARIELDYQGKAFVKLKKL